jgi:hypothetical protein
LDERIGEDAHFAERFGEGVTAAGVFSDAGDALGEDDIADRILDDTERGEEGDAAMGERAECTAEAGEGGGAEDIAEVGDAEF